MLEDESKINTQKVCDIMYLAETLAGKKQLILEIMDEFLIQVSEELKFLNDAIISTDYTGIKNYAHTMKSTVSIMGISVLIPVLQEMEDLGKTVTNIEKIIQLNHQLNLICKQAIAEIEIEKLNYV